MNKYRKHYMDESDDDVNEVNDDLCDSDLEVISKSQFFQSLPRLRSA